MNAPAAPLSRLHGRRKGRPLRVRKTRLMQELLPQVQIQVPAEGGVDPAALFDTPKKALWLEIGFGGGEHLAAQAKQNPDVGFIGCEPFVNGIASLLDHLDRDQIKNVRLFPDDARVLIDALPSASVARCFVLFADPWPKARHAERRFIGPENLQRLARVLQPGAELRVASDDPGLIVWTREQFLASPVFTCAYDSQQPMPDWVATRYEQKAIQAGRQPSYMSYISAT